MFWWQLLIITNLGAKMVSRIWTTVFTSFTLNRYEVFCNRIKTTTWGVDPVWINLTYISLYLYPFVFFCDHVDSGIEKPLACYSILFSFCTYLFVSYLYWHMFFTFSAIKNPKKDFSSDLPIGASPRRHKELLVHEEEDSRHLEHSWEPSPPQKKINRDVYIAIGGNPQDSPDSA